MKKRFQLAFLLVLLLALALPGTAYARGLFEDKVVFGGNFTLESGETLDGALLVFGGTADLESGSTVAKDVVVMGGTVVRAGRDRGRCRRHRRAGRPGGIQQSCRAMWLPLGRRSIKRPAPRLKGASSPRLRNR